MTRNGMSVAEAVGRYLRAWEPGTKRLGYEITDGVRRILWDAGTGRRPLESTILRRVREQRDLYGVHEEHHGGSVYVKEAEA